MRTIGAAVFERRDVIHDDGLANNVLFSAQHADRIAPKDARADLHPLAAACALLDSCAHRIDLVGGSGRNRRDGCEPIVLARDQQNRTRSSSPRAFSACAVASSRYASGAGAVRICSRGGM
ncbi:hypothetical protein [Burkholderia pseudomallei]|uniref:hypothetical protein n=1 Tax=Burkholderia pseudomallei TaxID=28450 RepID=UPI000A8F9210|nr:hypothetical protein [Burkholderia pseudomallei]